MSKNLVLHLIGLVGVCMFIAFTYASLSLVTQSSTMAAPVVGEQCTVGCLFNPAATLDTTQVDDLRPTARMAAAVDYGAGNGAVCGTDAQCRAWDHAHGITDHQLPVDPTDPHDADRHAMPVVDDVTAEGQDVLMVEYASTPAQLWTMLREAGFRGDPADQREALYVPVGTVVQDDGGLYLATLDGFMVCVDDVTVAGECSATGPVVPVAMPLVP